MQLEASENVNNVSGLLKLYLRSLPQPLLLFDNYETIISCCRGGPRKRAQPAAASGLG